ncbi:MAG: hypothetical protein ACOYLI_11870 [Synechococcus lacustris]
MATVELSNAAELAAAFRKLEALQAAAAAAGPAIDALLEATRASGESRPYAVLGITVAVAAWCRSQAINPAAPLQAAHNDPAHDAIIKWVRR